MRPLSLFFAWAIASVTLVVSAEEAEPRTGRGKELFRPELFQTLVNPNCSHCIDEAKRRRSELRDDDRVLAWTRGKYEGGAVPWRFFLVPYRVISDTYGVFVYDADAGFVRGYEPSLDFRFHGWRNGIMVIRHKDGTLYSALSGRAFDGPRKGDCLKPIATIETDWGYWSNAYPGSVAYHMFDKYQPQDVPHSDNAESASTRLQSDPRGVGGQTRVIGLTLAGRSKAWPLAALEASGGVLEDELGDEKLLLLWYAATQTAAIYSPQIEPTDPAAPSQTLSFVRDDGEQRAAFHDRETGSRWGIEGRAVAGPLKGKTLRWLPGVQCRWFAWAAEYPDTELQSGQRDVTPPKRVPDALPKRKATPAGATSQIDTPARQPLSAIIVEPETVSDEQTAVWRRDGYQAAAVVLDELHDLPAESIAAARQAATQTGAGAVFVAQTRIDQSYEPRVVAVTQPSP